MMELQMVVDNIAMVDLLRNDITVHVITFRDGSQLEVGYDRMYRYPMGKTPGFAELVSVYDLQRIDFRYFMNHAKQA